MSEQLIRDGYSFFKEGEKLWMRLNSDSLEEQLYYAQNKEIKNFELNYTQGFIHDDLRFLEKLKEVEGVSIVFFENADISSLNCLRNLKYLSLNRAFSQKIDFSNFPKLETCYLDWDSKYIGLERCDLLNQLTLRNYRKRDLSELSTLINLRKLKIVSSTITSLKGIQGMASLRMLQIAKAKKLSSLKGLESLRFIEKLLIENCTNVNEINELGFLNSLNTLSLHNVKSLTTIKPLKNLDNLQVISLTGNTIIEDFDLTPLVGRRDAICSPNKNYNLTGQEIDQLNNTTRKKQTWDY